MADKREELILAAQLGQDARIFLGTKAYRALVEDKIQATQETILSLSPASESFHHLKARYDALVELRNALEGLAEEGVRAAHEFETGEPLGDAENTRRML